jgi:hypothetical protein
MKEISAALLKAQTEMSNPKKGSNNPYFKSKYADLNSVREAVIPVLNSNGISVIQPMVHLDGRNFIKTVLLHESGEMLESFTEIVYAKTNDAQAQGSGITYARRYGLQSMVCVGADDDDGNAASQPKKDPKTPEKPDAEKSDAEKAFEKALQELSGSMTIMELQTNWAKYPKYQTNKLFLDTKDKLKTQLK